MDKTDCKNLFTMKAHDVLKLVTSIPERVDNKVVVQVFIAIKEKTIAGLIVGAIIASISSTPSFADSIKVLVDRAKVMRISRPAATIIVGNPAIADATIQDATTLVLTGKSFGTTNLIILDADGEPIADEIVSVESPNNKVVTVYKRTARVSYSCTPVCERALTLGDNEGAFEVVKKQINDRNGVLSATTGGSANGGPSGQ